MTESLVQRALLKRARLRLARIIKNAWRGGQPRSARDLLRREDEWAIGIYFGASPFSFEPDGSVDNPVLTRSSVTDVQASYVADPFMVQDADTWYMFFEVLNRDSGKGEIGLATSANGRTWTYRTIVLNEPFHLSYPYVFEWNSDWYMVPESCAASAIRLYRADPFPTRWVHVKNLLTTSDLVDPTLISFRDNWWMFAASGRHPRRAENLHVFYADDLMGCWQEHRASPVIHGNAKMARPGGRIVPLDEGLIRYTQDCESVYGQQVRAYVIKELTPERYREEGGLDRVVTKPAADGWNAVGMHHVDAHPLSDGRWIACVDGWRWVSPVSPGCSIVAG